VFFAIAQGSYLLSGGRYVQGGSQRLSSALARAIKVAGGRSAGAPRRQRHHPGFAGRFEHGHAHARDEPTPRWWSAYGSSAMPRLPRWRHWMPAAAAEKLTENDRRYMPSIFAVRAHARPVETAARIRFSAYSTQLLPPEMARLSDYAQGTALMAEEPGKQMPPMSIVDYAAIDSGCPRRLCAVNLWARPLSNWDSSDMDAYREKRGRWQQAIVGYLSSVYPGLADAVGGVVVQYALSCGNISMRPTARSTGSRRHRHARSGASGALAAHGGARGLSGVSLCGFRRLFRRGSIRRRLRDMILREAELN